MAVQSVVTKHLMSLTLYLRFPKCLVPRVRAEARWEPPLPRDNLLIDLNGLVSEEQGAANGHLIGKLFDKDLSAAAT